jgi:hypothetical protein
MSQNQTQTQIAPAAGEKAASELADIICNEWERLHPVTRIVIKILQHLQSKLNDFAEIRLYLLEDGSLFITTYKSEIRISKDGVFFKRWSWDNSVIRVQRAKIELPDELIEIVKTQILDLLDHDIEPNYRFVAEAFEKTLRS